MDRFLGLVCRVGRFRQVEIKQLRAMSERQQYVSGLDVAVIGSHSMSVMERSRQDHREPGGALSERPACWKSLPTVAPGTGATHFRRQECFFLGVAAGDQALGRAVDQHMPQLDGLARPAACS